MKNYSLLRSLRILSIFAVSAVLSCCTKIGLESENPEPRNLANTFEPKDIDQGISYLGKDFYLGNVDMTKTTATRSGESETLLTRNFSIVAKTTGDSYLGVHVMAAYLDENKTLQQIGVLVNDEYVGELDIKVAEWDFVTLKNGKTITLVPGNNKITFTANPPYYPEVDAIQVDKNAQNLMKEDPQYIYFINHLRVKRASSMEKLEQATINSDIENQKNSEGVITTRSAWDQTWNWQVTPQVLSNPDGNYNHMIKVPITYTYHRKLSLTQGTYTFMTGPISGDDYYSCDPVMYLYKINDPHNYSYYNDDYSGMGLHPRISVNLPAGDYYLVIRAYSSYYATTTTGRQGLVNVFQNGTLINSQCPIAGYSVDVDSPNTGTINYFTAYSTGLPEFFLEEKGSNKAKFFGEMYFYAPPMEQMWWNDARLRLNKPSANDRYRMIISSVGAFGAYYGNCDVYGSCQQVQAGSNIANSFPNLMLNDAIYSSAFETNTYNCASWAGGITTGWMWGYYGNYGNPYLWSTWDNFFGNNPLRYAGATTYTRDNADYSNGEIAVWSLTGSISEVKHFSVRGTANNHPHGYAWESKPGGFRRIFHPRDALRGSNYGNIFAYYRDASKNPYGIDNVLISGINENISLDESIRRGLTVIEKVELTPQQQALFSSVSSTTKSGLSFNTSEIEKRYNAWANRISQADMEIISDPYVLISNKEGLDLIMYCKKNQKDALAFFANLYFIKSEDNAPKQISAYLFCNIFYEYADVIESIKSDWGKHQFNSKGAYIAPMPDMFLKKYAKELIGKIL